MNLALREPHDLLRDHAWDSRADTARLADIREDLLLQMSSSAGYNEILNAHIQLVGKRIFSTLGRQPSQQSSARGIAHAHIEVDVWIFVYLILPFYTVAGFDHRIGLAPSGRNKADYLTTKDKEVIKRVRRNTASATGSAPKQRTAAHDTAIAHPR